jgi:aryl carrier-like protein
MLQRALKVGFSADYVLIDSWFTQAPLLQKLMDQGLHVIRMVKELKQRYIFEGQHLSLSELYAKIPKNRKAEILGSVRVKTSNGLALKIVFVRNRNNRRDWLGILTTDPGLRGC